ncbi:MAG: hypothetical protein Q7S13_05265 [Candidatus Omnitrophota bacterium]|nr:hypothetical protein [Candidatus Omnitrophota bacterium]
MQGSIIQTKGWIDWFSRNMQAAVTIIQPEKKKMIEARAVANHNVLNVEGVLSLPKVAVGSYKDLTADPQQKQDGLNEIPSVDVGIETKFSFQTKLDDPRIEKIRFHGRVKAQTDVPPLSEKLPAPTQQPSVDAAMTTEVVSPPIELPQNSVQNSSDFPAEDSK